MQNKSFYFPLLLFLSLCSNSALADFDKTLVTADSLFEQKKYTESFEIYEELLETHAQASPRMLLKMAFIKEGLGDYSNALYYLNQYYLKTSDKHVRDKMKELAEQYNLSGFVINDADFVVNVINKYESPIFISSILLAFLFLGLVLYQKLIKKRKPIVSSIAFVFALLGLFYLINYGTKVNQGIIIDNYTYLMSGPSSGADLIEIVDKGHRVKTFQEHGPWLEILWNDQRVFIKKNKVRKLG